MSHFSLRTCTLTQHPVAHEHTYHQLILATSGTTELSVEGRGARITRELGCLIPSHYHHAYQGDGDNRTLVLDIPLSSMATFPCADELERIFARPDFFRVSPELHRLATALMQQVELFPELRKDIATLLLRSLYLSLYRRHLPSTEPATATRHYRVRLDLDLINAHIDAHLGDEIKVEQLAALCALSPGHFHASFRTATGQTPISYVQQRRLEHARALVRHSELSLGQIGSLVGFSDQGSFTRAYGRVFGITPSAHRRA